MTMDYGFGDIINGACSKCGHVMQRGDYPFCPHGIGINGAIGDECDIWQENGFRHPQHFTSKKARLRALAAAGKEERVCNAGIHDKHVARWVTMDPQTLKNAQELVSRNGAYAGNDPEPEPLQVTWQVRDVDPKTGPGAWRDCAAPR